MDHCGCRFPFGHDHEPAPRSVDVNLIVPFRVQLGQPPTHRLAVVEFALLSAHAQQTTSQALHPIPPHARGAPAPTRPAHPYRLIVVRLQNWAASSGSL